MKDLCHSLSASMEEDNEIDHDEVEPNPSSLPNPA